MDGQLDAVVGLDWVGYFHSLSNVEVHQLAAWLAAEYLEVWEFKEIVDRVYAQAAQASGDWRDQSTTFVTCYGRPAVERYARRKRRFGELTAALHEAYLCGALPGDVAPEELEPLPVLHPLGTTRRSMEELLGVLEHIRGGGNEQYP
jgi:hypothetical protein